MKLSYSKLTLFAPEREKDMQSEHGEENVTVRASFDSTETNKKPFIDLCLWNEDNNKVLNIALEDIHCQQIVDFLQSHLQEKQKRKGK